MTRIYFITNKAVTLIFYTTQSITVKVHTLISNAILL